MGRLQYNDNLNYDPNDPSNTADPYGTTTSRQRTSPSTSTTTTDTSTTTDPYATNTAPTQNQTMSRTANHPTDTSTPGAVAGAVTSWQGDGWQNPRGTAAVLQEAFSKGLTGQAAVDWATANGAPGIAYYADSDQYGLPDGQYVAKNAKGTYDLIQRSTSTSSTPGSVQADDPYTNQLRQAFLDQLKNLQTPITAASPQVAGAIGQYNAQGATTLAQLQKSIAERNYAQGTLNTSEPGQQQTQAQEAIGQDESQYAANLVNTAEQNREAQLAQLLGLGTSQINNANQLGLGYDQLGYQYAGLQAQLNQYALMQALGYL